MGCPIAPRFNTLTVKVRREAESIISLVVFVSVAIVAHPWGGVLASALVPGVGNGILHGAVLKPAGVAPVQALQPGLVELSMGGQDGVLLLANLLGLVVVELVAPHLGVVWEHHT